MYTPIGITQPTIKMDEQKALLLKRIEELEKLNTERPLTAKENEELIKAKSDLQSIQNFEPLP